LQENLLGRVYIITPFQSLAPTRQESRCGSIQTTLAPQSFEASIPEFCADASLISCSQATIKGNTMSIKVS